MVSQNFHTLFQNEILKYLNSSKRYEFINKSKIIAYEPDIYIMEKITEDIMAVECKIVKNVQEFRDNFLVGLSQCIIYLLYCTRSYLAIWITDDFFKDIDNMRKLTRILKYIYLLENITEYLGISLIIKIGNGKIEGLDDFNEPRMQPAGKLGTIKKEIKEFDESMD